MRLGELARLVGAELHGDPEVEVSRVAALDRAVAGSLAFLSSARFRRHLSGTQATAVILSADALADCPVHALVSGNPYLAYARAAQLLHPQRPPQPGVHPSAVIAADATIDPSAEIGPLCVIGARTRIAPGVRLGPHCVIGDDCLIGDDTRLTAQVTVLDGVRIGRRVLIHAGAVIGADGFGFARDGEVWVKIPQLGTVVIGDDVEVGANTTIDRGALGDTVVGEGVKLDNLVQIAHNVQLGAHSIMAGCAGIAGSTRIGRGCAFGGGAGVAGHLEIADNVTITAMSLVTHSIREAGSSHSSGTTAEPTSRWRRNAARFKQLDELARRVGSLEKAVGCRTPIHPNEGTDLGSDDHS
ncbi:MAG: UDP-3-O-(3-hydroxymyristoyl)glucosamine N-acyltransferase [Chromatiales bacterium]|nr:UDP-3-O-(3-hydroxymyristoyl)glucosamine N-acyltransferase [Chromatiales bacterium]